MSKSGVYGVVLPREVAREARVVAAMEGKSRSKLMRDLLEKYLKSYPGGKIILKSQNGVEDGQPS